MSARRIAPPPVPRAQSGRGQAQPVGGRSPRWGRSRAPRAGETRWEGATDPRAALVPQDAACGARHEQLGLQVSALRLRGGWSAPAGEERAHTQQRSRVATTGHNTLKREFAKIDAPAELQVGGALEPSFVKNMGVAARAGDRGSALWRA